MNAQTKCPMCGAIGTIRDASVEHTATVGPRVFVAALPGRVCGSCNEAIFTTATVDALEAAITRALVFEGANDGAATRWVRKSAGLTRLEFARLLGIDPEAVTRWEHGAAMPDRPALALLGALAIEAMDGRTDTRARLEAMASAAARSVDGDTPARVVLTLLPSAA